MGDYVDVLTDDQVARFRSDGVVHLSQAVDQALVEEILDSVERLIESPGRFGGDMTPNRAPGMFFQDRYLHPKRPDFRRFAQASGCASVAAKATNSTNVRLYYDHVFVKDPGTQERFVWHQDRPYWAVDGTQICSTWLALTDANAHSSALEFVRSSHLWDRTFRPEYPALEGLPPGEVERALWKGVAQHIESFDDVCPAFEEHPDLYEVLSFEVVPGDVLLFDFRTVHRSRPNDGKNRRAAISWRWLGDDAFWAPKDGADPIIRDRDTVLEPGDLITDDQVFPLIHSR